MPTDLPRRALLLCGTGLSVAIAGCGNIADIDSEEERNNTEQKTGTSDNDEGSETPDDPDNEVLIIRSDECHIFESEFAPAYDVIKLHRGGSIKLTHNAEFQLRDNRA